MRSTASDWAAAELALLIRRTLTGANRKRISRVKTLILKICIERAAELVRAGPGQNIYARRGLIVLRRERILINADLADGFLRRKVSA